MFKMLGVFGRKYVGCVFAALGVKTSAVYFCSEGESQDLDLLKFASHFEIRRFVRSFSSQHRRAPNIGEHRKLFCRKTMLPFGPLPSKLTGAQQRPHNLANGLGAFFVSSASARADAGGGLSVGAGDFFL